MTKEKRLERLKAHEDTQEIDYAGKTRHWMLGRYALKLAKERGVPVGELISDIDPEESEDDITESFDQFAKLLWVGFLPFPDDRMDLEDVELLLSFGDLGRLAPKVMGPLQELQENVEAAGKGKTARS